MSSSPFAQCNMGALSCCAKCQLLGAEETCLWRGQEWRVPGIEREVGRGLTEETDIFSSRAANLFVSEQLCLGPGSVMGP